MGIKVNQTQLLEMGLTSFISVANLNNFAAVVSDNLHNAALSNFIYYYMDIRRNG